MKTLIVKLIHTLAPDIALMLTKRWFSRENGLKLRAAKHRLCEKFRTHATKTSNEIDDQLAEFLEVSFGFSEREDLIDIAKKLQSFQYFDGTDFIKPFENWADSMLLSLQEN